MHFLYTHPLSMTPTQSFLLWFSLHDPTRCYRGGYMREGKLHWNLTAVGTCTGGPLQGRTWFFVRLLVRGDEIVIVQLRNITLYNTTAHHRGVARVGVAVLQGHNNTIYFRNVTVVKRNMTYGTGSVSLIWAPLLFNYLQCMLVGWV